VNRLNVFPVPDGDTGTNMLLTLQSAVEDIKDSNSNEVSKIARIAAHGSLMGARGNSGVIFSQIVRGAAEVIGAAPGVAVPVVASAFRGAADAAYRAVRRPVEGTMLTVIREMADEAQSRSTSVTSVVDLLPIVLRRGEEAASRSGDNEIRFSLNLLGVGAVSTRLGASETGGVRLK